MSNNHNMKFGKLTELTEKIKANSFIDGEDNIKIEIINLIKDAANDLNNGGVTRTSVRNVYNAFKDLERQFEQTFIYELSSINIENIDDGENNDKIDKIKKESFKTIHPFIKMMDGKIKYLVNRKNEGNKNIKNGYEVFYDFNSISIDKINNYKEFEAFIKIFECLYGFLKKGSEN